VQDDKFEVYFELLLSIVLAKTPFVEGAAAGLPASPYPLRAKKNIALVYNKER
jgi:hypothetical protein